jgi:hypothetical protein
MSVRLIPGITAFLAVLAAASGLAAGTAAAQPAPVTYLAGSLVGANEVGGGDPDGRATVVLRVEGSKVSFAVRWDGIEPPSAFHLHAGAKGTNGAVRLGFFGSSIPTDVRAVSGTVSSADSAFLSALTTTPRDFYANLHNAEFPGGAVRSQLHKLNRPVDLKGVLNGTSQPTLEADARGFSGGDPNGRARVSLALDGTALAYAATWERLAPVTGATLRRGGAAVAGLFTDPDGLPESITGAAGVAQVGTEVAEQLRTVPRMFSAALSTTKFGAGAGAVRGQLAKTTGAWALAVNARVVSGMQIYRCVGSAFTQFGVAAGLEGDILHSFATPAAGPPQWIAPDASAVTGRAVTSTPNGDANINELVLDATQSGASTGLLASTTQILRLNTIGGRAPVGPCTAGTIATSPYLADYVFLG